MEIRLAHNNKCKISHTKLVKIKQYQSCTSLELFSNKILWMLGLHQSPIYLTLISLTNSIILELWKKKCIHAYKNWEKGKIILKSKKIYESACQNENDNNKLIKIRIFGDLKP